MKRACIVTIDAACARIFMYQEQTNPGFEMVEIATLENAGRRLKDSELFSESRPSLKSHGGLKRAGNAGNRSDSGEPGSASDDHRNAHIEEMDSKFAKLAIAEINELCRRHQLAHLVVFAGPKMLGTLRAEGGLVRDGRNLEEHDKDLSSLSEAQLHDYVADMGVVPPRARLKMAR